jgi:hypothetical protein
MTHRKLAVRVPSEYAARFEAAMRARGQRSVAAALRSLIDATLVSEEGTPAGAGAAPVPIERPAAQGRRRRLWVYVTPEEVPAIQALAAPFGGVTAWFRGILDARMGRAHELPAREEIEALHQATVQLGRVATNINQIARTLNTARLAGEPIPPGTVEPQELGALKAVIDEVSARATAVIFAARKRVFNG